MKAVWRIAVLLLLLLLTAQSEAQSGDGDTEPRISCTSHITTNGSSLTCQLLGGRTHSEDDEDEEDDGIEKMCLCYTRWADGGRAKCVKAVGATISSKHFSPVLDLNLTVHLKRGGRISTTVHLKKIVKPRPPQVWNVTFDQESNQVVLRIRTPYHRDYLNLDNQLFQLHISTAGSTMIQNISSQDFLPIDTERLQRHRRYEVRVRAIPHDFLRGTWSDWSDTFTFITDMNDTLGCCRNVSKARRQTDDGWVTAYKLIVCLVSVVVLTSSAVVFWRNKIFTYMWPSIPHPKQTLVHICKPNKGLLLNLKPDVFSALKVYPLEKAAGEEAEPSIGPCSTQSSDCRSATSVSTEELEVSALLSGSSSSGEDSLPSASPSPLNVRQLGERAGTPPPGRHGGGNEGEALGVSQQEEAYVTMSSFYQIK